MTEDNAKNKLTLSGKSTLTLKGVGSLDKTHNRDGKKVVQVEVRKKRVINPGAVKTENKVEIDDSLFAGRSSDFLMWLLPTVPESFLNF